MSGRVHQWTAPRPTVKTGGANFQMSSTLGPTLPPTGVPTQSAVRPPYGQQGMYVPQPLMYGQPPMMQQPVMQANLFPQQQSKSFVNDPFGAPVPNNQPLL